jgi:hypothetical protein
MGFEMSNDGGAASSTGGGNGGGGVNAYGAAPPPAPPGGLLVPNALGGQAQPVIVSDAGDGAALASPDALDSKVETGTGSNYARIYVTDSTSGAIAYTNRLGAVPSNALPEEPKDLTKPDSLGYVASTGSVAVPAARIDTLFNEKDGIYDYTQGQHYSFVKGDMGIKVNNDLILAAGADGSGDLDISSGGQTRIFSKNGPIYLFSGNDINIDAVRNVNITTKGSAKITVEGSDSAIKKGNSLNRTHGSSTDFFLGMKNQFSLSSSNTFNLGTFFSITTGLSWSIFLTSRITWVNLTEIKIVNGSDIKIDNAKSEISALITTLKLKENEAIGIKGAAFLLDFATSPLQVSNRGLGAVKEAIKASMSTAKVGVGTADVEMVEFHMR